MGREEYESGKFTTMNIMAGYFQEQPPLYPKIKSSNLVKVEVTEKGHSYWMKRSGSR
ncbi:hypothetical protein C808_01180 [Lachnospiraceae bacterium M18-1]|jgi:hypothetical protein|nr:hypothetical protein C808_01180 [Lachnospiraceae bacterium M18-1]